MDYPPFVAAVIFFSGCNLRCPWCHNGELAEGVVPENENLTGLDAALELIEKRRDLLGGVVLSGGEPTLYPGLVQLTGYIKNLGVRVKLDTNGMRPDILEEMLKYPQTRPDYIAMDLKLAPGRYRELLPPDGGIKDPGKALKRSAALLRISGVPHEFRTLALPGGYFGETDRTALKKLAGGSPWKLRPFVPGNCLDPAWNAKGL